MYVCMYIFNCRQIKAVVRSCVKNIPASHQPMVGENADTAVTQLPLLHPPGEVTDTAQYRHTEGNMYRHTQRHMYRHIGL